ncbi:MAG: SLC13 family permease, partial [Candidatus Brocadiia bacterium]
SLTALFSAFMSNTACTAMMMAIMLPAVAAVGQGDRFRVAVILAVPYAANIGGMITPIGTPPNAVAVGALAKQGLSVDFFQWVLMAAPFALVMLAFMWLLFMKMFPPATKTVDIVLPQGTTSNWRTWTVYGIFGATVALWLTGPVHNLPDAIPALLPVAAFTALGILSSKDFNTMSWDILWLIAGGLTLGDSMEKTGLSKWVIGQVNWSGMAPWLLIGAFALGAMLLSEFMSHTAASNIFVPLGVAFATGIVPEAFGIADKNWFIVSLVVAIGLATSLAMALPISTPPNAIAYGTGQIKNKDMLVTGLIIGAVGITLLAFGMPALWDFWKGIGLIR